jgi:hypothetical protein
MQTSLVVALVAGGAFAAWRLFAPRRRGRRLADLARTRNAQDSVISFRAALPEVSEPFRSEMYGLIQRLLPIPNFPVHPNDNIWMLYDLDQGTLESEIEDYLVTRNEALRHFQSDRGITTVVELVRMVDRHKVPADTQAGPNKSPERTRER